MFVQSLWKLAVAGLVVALLPTLTFAQYRGGSSRGRFGSRSGGWQGRSSSWRSSSRSRWRGGDSRDRRSRDRRSGSSSKMSREEFLSRLKSQSDSYFRRQDRNKDGQLDKDEMSSRLRGRYEKYDSNGDGKISSSEAKSYVRAFLERVYESRIAHWKYSGIIEPTTTNVDQSILEKRPVVFRGGHLPEELHDTWFEDSDRDGDGQIGLYEWRYAGKDLEDFGDFDRNNDGLLTPAEMLYYQKHVAGDNIESENVESGS